MQHILVRYGMRGGQKRTSSVPLCHSLLYALETEFLPKPGAPLVASKVPTILSLLLTMLGLQVSVNIQICAQVLRISTRLPMLMQQVLLPLSLPNLSFCFIKTLK